MSRMGFHDDKNNQIIFVKKHHYIINFHDCFVLINLLYNSKNKSFEIDKNIKYSNIYRPNLEYREWNVIDGSDESDESDKKFNGI